MLILGTVLLMLAAASAVNVIPSAALDPPPPPIAAEPLTARSVFPDEVDMKFKLKHPGGGTMVINVDDPSRTVDVKYTVQPGAQFPWHSHYGPVIVNIISGSLTYVPAGTCEERTYSTASRSSTPDTGTCTPPSTPGRRRCSSPRSSRRPRLGRCSFRQTLVASEAELAGKLLVWMDPRLGRGSVALSEWQFGSSASIRLVAPPAELPGDRPRRPRCRCS
jgi:hypothetical protein